MERISLYVLTIILLGFGIIQTIYPEGTYMFGIRWMFAEGSQLNGIAKIFLRIAGIAIIFVSVALFIKITQMRI